MLIGARLLGNFLVCRWAKGAAGRIVKTGESFDVTSSFDKFYKWKVFLGWKIDSITEKTYPEIWRTRGLL